MERAGSIEQRRSGAGISRRGFISAALILLVLMIGAGILMRLVPAGQYRRTVQDACEVLDPTTALYATCFEFGCPGDSLLAQIDSLWCAVANNRMRRQGAAAEAIADKVRRLWREAYCPSEPSWEEHAHRDALRAFAGILHDQGLIS